MNFVTLDGDYGPAVLVAKVGTHTRVPIGVLTGFLVRELQGGPRRSIIVRTTVPETAVYERGNLWTGEEEVGSSWKAKPKPKTKISRIKSLGLLKLGLDILLSKPRQCGWSSLGCFSA